MMKYEWHSVEDMRVPDGVLVIGKHSEWYGPVVVVQRRRKWFWMSPQGEKPMPDTVSPPLHWARLPIGYRSEA